MPDIDFDYNTFRNHGFRINPEYRGFDGKTPHQALSEALYYYANSDNDNAAAERAREIFGPGIMPLDSPHTNYFVGRAILERSGYTGSPYQYYIQNNIPIPQGLKLDVDAYELIGKQAIADLRNLHQRNQQRMQQVQRANQEIEQLHTTLPQLMAGAVLDDNQSATLSGRITPEAYNILAENGFIVEQETSLLRARNAWQLLGNPQTAEDFRKLASSPQRMASVAEALTNDEGNMDELAFVAFLTAMENRAKEAQPEDSSFWDSLLTQAQMFIDAAEQEGRDKATRNPNAQLAEFAFQNAIARGKSQAEAEREAQALDPNRSTRTTPATRRLIAAMRIGADTATRPSERAAWYNNALTNLGRISGQSLLPTAGSIAFTAATRGRGAGVMGTVARGWLGSYAASRDSLVNTARYNAYLQGVTNPELYGTLEGEASAMAEGVFSAGGSLLASWKLVGGLYRRAAASATVRSGLINRPFLRASLAYAGVTTSDALGELGEEELASALSSAAISIAHSTGADVSLKDYKIGETLSQISTEDTVSIFLFSAITGSMGAPANYQLARQLAKDRASLTRFLGEEGANKIVEADLAHESNIANILASNISEAEKQQRIREAEAAFVSFLGTELEEQVLNNPEAALANIEADDKRLISEEAARLLMQSQAAIMGLRQHGIMGATPNGDGTYVLTFQVKNKEGEPQLVHRTWNEQQLVNFLRFQGNTKLYQDIMSYQSVLSANEYAKALSPEDIGASLVSIMETKAASIFMEHGGVITEDFIKALAEAVSQDADIFPYLNTTQLNAIAAAMSERKKNAMATTEGKELGINEDTKVIFPALNIRKPEGSYIIAYAAGQTRLADFMEELFEVDIKQRIESGKTTLKELEAALTKVEERMPGITLLERKDGKVTQNAIVEAYSKLAQANLLTNIANLQTLTPAEKEVLTDTISVMRKGKLIQTLAGAWKTYTAENAANADANINKLINIMEEAGFSFGERFQGTLTAANHRMQVIEALGFVDFEQQAQEIAEGAAAQDEATIANVQELADVTPEEQQEHAVKAGYDPESGELATNGQLTHIDEKTGREATRNMNGSITITINPNQIFVADVLKDTPIIKANFDASGQEIVAIRDDAGNLHAVSGISQLQNAKEQGVNFTKVTIFDNFKAWSNDNIIAYNAYQNIISGQGLTQDYTNFFRYSKPMSDAEAMEAGVCTYTTDGTPTPSYILGKQRSVFVNDQYSKSGKWPSDVLTGEVKVSRITLSPEVKQFKTTKAGREADSRGVVYELPGEYRPHDPIHLWHRKDGTLVVISGRHRLAKAIEAGAENILATVFPETESRDARWARIHDFEQNVMDNQASVSDVAVYVQGYNPMARKLTEEETAQFNRPKSNAEKGINIGLHGSTDVLNYLATGGISGETADKIVSFAPDDAEIQKVALGVFLESGSISEALDAARIYKEARDMKSGNLFASLGSEQRKEAFAKFLAKYAANKRRELGVQKNLRKGAKDSKSVKRIEEAGLSFDDVDKRRGEYNEYSVKQDAWRNLSTHPELIAEAKEAFDNTAEGQQQYFNFGEFDESQQQGGFLDFDGSFSIASAEEKGMMPNGVLEASNAVVTAPSFSIDALHASPHNFRKFSTDFMGTGEGAQVYGWGLYFMENLLVNRAYFNQFADLNKEPGILLDGKRMRRAEVLNYFSEQLREIDSRYSVAKSRDEMSYVLSDVSIIGGGLKGFLERAEKAVNRYSEKLKRNAFGYSEYGLESVKIMRDVAQLLAEHDIQPTHPFRTAINYRVELNVDDSNLLLWDNPVSDELFKAADVATNNSLSMVGLKTARGKAIYETLAGYFESKQEASEWLAAHGYKGIKYLDGNSRIKGEGTYNYVIFSGDDVKITAVNESGIWSMEEGWQEYNDPTANFSIAPVDELMNRFEGNTLAERMANFIKRESKRLSKALTLAPNTETATKAIADVTAIMHSLDKYVENGTFHISNDDRKALRTLVRLADKYGEMIYKGKFRSLKKADKETAERFKAEVEAIAHEEAIKEQQRKVNFHLKNKDSALKKAETAKTEDERQKYLKLAEKHQQLADAREASVSHDDFLAARHKIAAQMAEGNAKEVVETMLNEAGDLLERYMKADISDRINKLLDQIRPKRSATKRFKGKLHASSYRRIDEIIDIMGMSKAAKDSELDAIHYAKQALERGDTPPKGMFPVLDTIREKLGNDATPEDIIEALNKREADVLTFGCIDGMTYQQAREAFNAFYFTLRMRRTAWEWKQEMEKNKINSIIYDFFGVDPSNLDEAELDVSKLGTDQNLRDLKDKLEKAKFTMPDSYMNAAQLFYALSSFKGLEGVFSDFMYKLSNNKIARELHLSDMRKKELRAFAAIKGMKPANSEEGFSDKELKGKVAAKFDDFFEANNKRVKTGITHTYTKKIKGVTGEVTEELELTKWEALDLILQYRQDDYKSNAESYGFTQDVMQKLEDFCGKDLMAFGNYIQQAIVNDGTVPVYEARTGVPMKENPKYFPSSANINTLNITSKEPLVNPQTGINPFGWQKERVKHDEELKASNAYTKYRLALTSRANYVYFEPITHMLERLLADKTFANGLHKAIGSQLFSQLIETINEIKGAAWQETVMQDVNNDKIMKAFATHALLTLPMKVTTLLRQLTSVANAGMLPGLNVVTCLPHIAGVFSGGGHKTFFDILNLPAFESRKRDNAFVNELMNMGNDATFSRALILARKGMDWIDRWDLCANAFSATVVYNHKYAQLEKQGGLSVTEMEKLAEQEVNLYLALLAQPLSRLDKSALYWRWSQNVLGRAFMYMGSESIQKVGMARAAYIINKNNGDGGVKNWAKLIVKTGLSIGAASFLIGLANAFIRGETPDEDDNKLAWYLATFLSESVGQYTDYLPAVGPIIDTALSPYAGWGEVKERIPGVSAITHGTKLYTMLTDDKDYSPAEWEMQLNRFNTELVPAFSALGYGTYSPIKWFSMATSTLTSLNAIGNLIYPFARGASNNAAWLPILPEGLEEFINKDDTRKPRRRKSLIERKLEALLD